MRDIGECLGPCFNRSAALDRALRLAPRIAIVLIRYWCRRVALLSNGSRAPTLSAIGIPRWRGRCHCNCFSWSSMLYEKQGTRFDIHELVRQQDTASCVEVDAPASRESWMQVDERGFSHNRGGSRATRNRSAVKLIPHLSYNNSVTAIRTRPSSSTLTRAFPSSRLLHRLSKCLLRAPNMVRTCF